MKTRTKSRAKLEDKQSRPTTGRTLGTMRMDFFVEQRLKKQGLKKAKKVEKGEAAGAKTGKKGGS